MSAPRFYCPPPLHLGATLELPPEAAHHAHRVLRLRVNDPVQLFDGEGHALDATISEINGKRVVLGKLKPCAAEPQPPLRIVLAQAMCSSEKMDWVVQKATELGAAEIQPVQTRRSVAKLSGERIERRTEHWRNVTIAACEQCGRNALPQVHAPQEFSVWLAQMRGIPDTRFILLPEAATALHEQPAPQGKVTLLIGPEGGFSIDEVQLARQAGFIPIRLGARVLRTETAAIAGIAALQTLWGDF
ncbi:MAG: 16S rRNA (uracil(1498)-N(3))-methyltransferase [Nitrosomonadales bacterium]|nr:16S rRNA (uracil(1498)-N(3))-methyltransferase [Nitrosomonadales bacterium]